MSITKCMHINLEKRSMHEVTVLCCSCCVPRLHFLLLYIVVQEVNLHIFKSNTLVHYCLVKWNIFISYNLNLNLNLNLKLNSFYLCKRDR